MGTGSLPGFLPAAQRRGIPTVKTILRATTVALATGALALGLVSPASAANEERNASRWLSKQLTDSIVHNEQYDFDDLGLSLDIALSLRAMDRKPDTVTAIRDAVSARASEYVGTDPEQYAGATAKLLTVVAETGGDATDVGGLDLVARMEGLTADSGRIADQSEFGDYANSIGQSLAVRGLSAVDSPEAWPAAQFLLAQQCEAGYFRVYFADQAAEDQTCDGGDAAASTPSTDATAFAVEALQSVQGHTAEVDAALEAARAWLVQTQKGNGSFGGGGLTEPPNTNSTGLGGIALGLLGECRKARLAAGWVKKLQVRGSDDSKLRREVGAIAYDATAFRKGERKGITVETRYQWQLASAQAAPVLRFLDKAACGQ